MAMKICSDMGNERQFRDVVMKIERQMNTNVHMRNKEKDYSQEKKDIPNTSQKRHDQVLVEIRESFTKLEKLIQEGNEDEYYGWVMKRKRVQWFALHQR